MKNILIILCLTLALFVIDLSNFGMPNDGLEMHSHGDDVGPFIGSGDDVIPF